jgi:carboxypeptidase C (cathepsin A)
MLRNAALLSFVAASHAAVAADLVPTLPGYGAPPTPWYSGYLHIPGGKHLHYIFISGPSPATQPVTAWFNGGPGCSSLEGLFAEMGQLNVDESNPSNLLVNRWAWTNISSMLFIEAPACVGYSYADTIDGCSHNDTSQAIDNYNALNYFFSQFPEYAANDFFITGESYAGIYVPTLAQQVVLGNAAGKSSINLRGIAVGNGCLGLEIGTCAFDYRNELKTNMPYFAGHGLISPTTFSAVTADCDPAADGPSTACQADFDTAHTEIGNVNIYVRRALNDSRHA